MAKFSYIQVRSLTLQAVPSRFPSPEPTFVMPSAAQQFTFPSTDGAIPELNVPDFSLPQMPTVQNQDNIFDFDVEGVNFNLDGFWDDFSLLGEQSGFPFK